MASLEYKKELLDRPRCINCGAIKKGDSRVSRDDKTVIAEIAQVCCGAPRYMTWKELVELERITFSKLMKAEHALGKRYLTKEDAGEVLKELSDYKQGHLWD